MLAELNGKSWKSLEAEFNQLSRTRTATPKWPRCSPSKRWPRWTPRSWASSPWTPCTRTKVPSLNKCTQHQKRSPRRATWWPPTPRWSHAQAGIAGAHTPISLTGGVLFVKRLGAYLKRLAAKLCRKVLRKVVKKVHKYVRRHVTRFCIKLCIKAAGKVYLLGGGSPAAGAVAAAIGAGCKIGCKPAFKALVKFIRHRYLSGAKMDVFVADYVCDSVGLKSEELVAIEDHSDEQWGFIKKSIKKRIKKFVKKSKKHFSRSKIHQYYKKYLSKYKKSRKKLKSWLKKRKKSLKKRRFRL